MAANLQQVLLSPAELAYLYTSLSLAPEPIRPDGRSATQFRPLVAETGILPGTNGSARICFSDGSEAIVGVKVEVEKTKSRPGVAITTLPDGQGDEDMQEAELDDTRKKGHSNNWVELAVDIPGVRDDDSGTAFLANMLSEALLADGGFIKRLWISNRFHWKMYLDVLLISQPLSYPLPLLSLTTHLALLATRLPRLISEGEEDPMFDDDWAASTCLYPSQQEGEKLELNTSRPPITLLVMTAGRNILFDPTYEELAVADAVLAVSVGEEPRKTAPRKDSAGNMRGRNLVLLSIRSIDPPSRLTPPGIPNEFNPATNGEVAGVQPKHDEARTAELPMVEGVWKAPRGGVHLTVLSAMVFKTLEKGGVADEVLDGLEQVELS